MNNEVKECRLLALLEQEFGRVEGARPKLQVVGGRDVKMPAPVNVERQTNNGWNRPRPLERILAAKRGMSS